MEFGTDGPWLVVKLQQGEPLLPSLEAALRQEGVTSGVVVAGIGALRDVELGWFDPAARTYVRHVYEGSRELVSLQGTVTLEADPSIHVHASLADEANRAVAGHVFRGQVAVLAEIAVLGLRGLRLHREVNPATGLNELTVRPAGAATK